MLEALSGFCVIVVRRSDYRHEMSPASTKSNHTAQLYDQPSDFVSAMGSKDKHEPGVGDDDERTVKDALKQVTDSLTSIAHRLAAIETKVRALRAERMLSVLGPWGAS